MRGPFERFFLDAKINFEYTASAEIFVQDIFHKETETLLRAIEYIPKPLVVLDEANTTNAVAVSEPDSFLLGLFGLAALAQT